MRREFLGLRTTESPSCEEYRWVREVGSARQVVLETCNDGYGAAMIGSDTVEVGAGTFTWTRSAGSNWRGTHRYGVDLRDWSATEEAHQIQFMGGQSAAEVRIDHRSHRAEARFWVPDCADAEPFTAAQPDFLDPWTARQRFVPVPVLADAPTGAALLDPGTCGAAASGDGRVGYITHGPTTSAADASLRTLLVSPNTLVITMEDDVAATPKNPESWVADDHVEIWIAPAASDVAVETDWARWLSGIAPYESCPATDTPIAQWGIRARDAAVFPGVNAGTQAPKAKLHTDGARRQLIVTLPYTPHRLSVVYSDADGARGQEQLVATSALRFNDPRTVGYVGPSVRCDVSGNQLVAAPVLLTPTDPATPVLGRTP